MSKNPQTQTPDNRYISEIEIKIASMKDDIMFFSHYVDYLENEDIPEPFSAFPEEVS